MASATPTPENKKNIVILISGSGSNMAAIARAADKQGWRGLYGAQVAAVISNRADAAGLALAQGMGIATAVVPHKDFASREAFDAELMARIDAHAPALVVLAGFMRILTPGFVQHYAGRLINIHPSLLPAFPGMDAYLQAYNAGVKIAGVTLHFVDDGVDSGPIILQRAFEREQEEEFDTFRARGMQLEYEIYAEFLKHLAEGAVAVAAIPGTDRKIVCLGKEKVKASCAPL